MGKIGVAGSLGWRMVALALLGAGAPPVVAQPPSSDILERLDSDDYDVREAATDELLQDNTLSVDDLAPLAAAAVSQEQKQRLISVVRHHFVRGLTQREFSGAGGAAMGVKLPRNAIAIADENHIGIQVDYTMPGFPAYVMLKRGDVIFEVDEQAVSLNVPATSIRESFIHAIRSHKPGSFIKLTVLRDQQVLEMDLPLAKRGALDAIYGRSALEHEAPKLAEEYQRQWKEVQQRLFPDDEQSEPLTVDWPS